jgi:hypothetical protein
MIYFRITIIALETCLLGVTVGVLPDSRDEIRSSYASGF